MADGDLADAPQPTLRVDVLGPVRVSLGGEEIGRSGRQQALVLAVLAAAGGGVVDRSRLIDILYDEDGPASAANVIQQRIAGLRRALGATAIETIGTGYRLALDVRTDAAELAAALADRPSSGSIERALDLWRGMPYADVPDTRWVQAERVRLDELRLQAHEARLESALVAGDHDLILRDVLPLLAEHPHRERLRAAQVRALHRSGRTVEALEAYDQARRWLAEELGIDPSEELRDAHAEVLADERPQPRPGTRHVVATLPRLPVTIGRDDVLDLIVRRVAEEPLVTILGAGGMGKTHLAIAVGHSVAERPTGPFDEIHLVRLANAQTAADVPPIACEALGVNPGADAVASLTAALVGRRVLLIWDNFEHVIDAAPMVAGLLDAVPGVHHLTTSRVPLDVRWEVRIPLDPLRDGSGAAELFASVARRRLRPDWQVEDADVDAVEAILARCGGLPLALELAASRLSAFSPRELAAELERSTRALSTRRGDVEERHRTFANSVAWSLDLLSDDLAADLARLAVFRGGFDVAAAAAMWDGDELAAREQLRTLLDHNLLQGFVADDGAARFTHYEPIRDLLVERTATPTMRAARDRHAAHYRERFGSSNTSQPMCYTADELAAAAAEQENLRAAIRHLINVEQVEDAAALLMGVGDLWTKFGPVTEPLVWAAQLLDHPDLPPTRRIDCLLLHGMELEFSADIEGFSGADHAEQALMLAEEIGDTHRAAWSAGHHSFTATISYAFRGMDPGGRAVIERSHARASEAAAAFPDDLALQAFDAHRASTVRSILHGGFKAADFERAVRAARRGGFIGMEVGVTNNYVQHLIEIEDFARAREVDRSLLGASAGLLDAALASQFALIDIADDHVAEGQRALLDLLPSFIASGNMLIAQEALLRVAASMSPEHATAVAEALGMVPNTAVIEGWTIRRVHATAETLPQPTRSAAHARGLRASEVDGFAAACREWLARWRAAGAFAAADDHIV